MKGDVIIVDPKENNRQIGYIYIGVACFKNSITGEVKKMIKYGYAKNIKSRLNYYGDWFTLIKCWRVKNYKILEDSIKRYLYKRDSGEEWIDFSNKNISELILLIEELIFDAINERGNFLFLVNKNGLP